MRPGSSREGARERPRPGEIERWRERIAAEPREERHWLALALALLGEGEPDEACAWLSRVLRDRADSPVAGLAASALAAEQRRRGDRAAAWKSATFATRTAHAALGFAELGALAAEEGDAPLAEHAAEAIAREPATPEHRALAAELRAAAAAERGDVEGAIEVLERALRACPSSASLADGWMRLLVRARGPMAAVRHAIDAIRAPVVASAAIGAHVRADDFESAIAIARTAGATTIEAAHAHLRAGDAALALAWLRDAGEIGRPHRIVWGLEIDDARVLDAAVADARPSVRELVLRARRGEPAAPAFASLAARWIAIAVDVRLRRAAQRLAATVEGGFGAYAAALHDGGMDREALAIARDHDDADSMRVHGVIAHAGGDLALAGELLVRASVVRIDQPVRAYALGVDALARSGRPHDARALLDRGLSTRPGSLRLAGLRGRP